jgi:transcriptional regulatory protein RtcR
MEDIEPNLDYELDRFAEREGMRVSFNKEARRAFLDFATAPDARWTGNFRDLGASVTRMATFAPSGRIDLATVEAEKARLKRFWSGGTGGPDPLEELIGPEQIDTIDPFDRVQLAEVVRVCRRSRSLSEAGRILFSASRSRRSSANDADRLRKYLQRYGLDWSGLQLSIEA